MSFDVRTATATYLQRQLEVGSLTSVQIVEAYLGQIAAHNQHGLGLRAVISTAPEKSLQVAHDLDRERKQGKVRSRLHGIPILVKDVFATDRESGLPTTAGAVAFEDTFAREDAEAVAILRKAGLIILGKASMTEFCGLKASYMTAGWSAINGQTQSAWILGGFKPGDLFIGRSTPGGSSSGSAVAVSAGFAPLALGSETSGSICLPANRAGVVSMKISRSLAPSKGIFPLSHRFDGVGGIAKSTSDLSLLIETICAMELGSARSVGFVDPKLWDAMAFQQTKKSDVEAQIVEHYHAARSRLEHHMRVVYPVSLPATKEMWYEGRSVLHLTSQFHFRKLFEKFCSTLESPRVKSLEELIQFNKMVERAMPEPHTDQYELEQILYTDLTEDSAAKATEFGESSARKAIDDALRLHDIDMIIGPGDCSLCVLAALAGYPTAMVPLHELHGPEGMGQPQGLMIIGTQQSEGKILAFMKTWEDIHGSAKVPLLLRGDMLAA